MAKSKKQTKAEKYNLRAIVKKQCLFCDRIDKDCPIPLEEWLQVDAMVGYPLVCDAWEEAK